MISHRRSGHHLNEEWKRKRRNHVLVDRLSGYSEESDETGVGENEVSPFLYQVDFGFEPSYDHLSDLRDRVEEAVKASLSYIRMLQRGLIPVKNIMFYEGDVCKGSRVAKKGLKKTGVEPKFDLKVRVSQKEVEFTRIPLEDNLIPLPDRFKTTVAALMAETPEHRCMYTSDVSVYLQMLEMAKPTKWTLVDREGQQQPLSGDGAGGSNGDTEVYLFPHVPAVTYEEPAQPAKRTKRVTGATELFRRFCALPESKGFVGTVVGFQNAMKVAFPQEVSAIIADRRARGKKNPNGFLYADNLKTRDLGILIEYDQITKKFRVL